MSPLTVEPFVRRLPRALALTPQLLMEHLVEDSRPPLRWAVVAVEGETLVIEGSRLCLS